MKHTINTIIIAAIISYVVAISASSTGPVTASKESVYDRVMRTGTIRCGYGISPPVLVQDPNTKQISGLDYDIWQEIGKELGLKIEFTEEAGWGNFIEGLKTRRYDAFCSGLWSDSVRAKHLTITVPIIYSFVEAFVRSDDHRFDHDIYKANNKDVTIPAVEGDVSMEMAKNGFPLAKIYALPQTATISDILVAVQTKKADIVFLDQAMIASFEKENPGVLRMLEGIPPVFVYGSHYGFLNGEIELRDMVNIALQKMIDDGRLRRMAESYSKDYVTPRPNFDLEK